MMPLSRICCSRSCLSPSPAHSLFVPRSTLLFRALILSTWLQASFCLDEPITRSNPSTTVERSLSKFSTRFLSVNYSLWLGRFKTVLFFLITFRVRTILLTLTKQRFWTSTAWCETMPSYLWPGITRNGTTRRTCVLATLCTVVSVDSYEPRHMKREKVSTFFLLIS